MAPFAGARTTARRDCVKARFFLQAGLPMYFKFHASKIGKNIMSDDLSRPSLYPRELAIKNNIEIFINFA